MSIINSQPLIGASGNQGYFLTKSLRFRSSASAYLNRTPASAGNRRTWTWSGWVKRGILSSGERTLFNAGGTLSDTGFLGIRFTSDDKLDVTTGSTDLRQTTQVFRDPSAWYHIVVAMDTTQATGSNRVKVYLNGTQITAFSTSNDPSLNLDTAINNTVGHAIGLTSWNSAGLFDGYMTEINFIDGQALTPSSFGSTNAATGVWQPIKYTGTYGTNGFYLPFTDVATTSGSNAGLGKDFSGNGNYWTTNNISVTSGTTYDSMSDVPTLTSATTANYAVMNPLDNYATTITNGNLQLTGSSSAWNTTRSTFAMPSGSWYCELTSTSGTGNGNSFVGIAPQSTPLSSISNSTFVGGTSTSWAYSSNGNTYTNGSVLSATGTTWASGSVIGISFTGSELKFYKNNALVTTISSIPTDSYCITTSFYSSDAGAINFGQRPFAYTPPTGFVALNTFNLPTPTIGATASSQANKYFGVGTYTGTGSATALPVVGADTPDFVWIKGRSGANSHSLLDKLRDSADPFSLRLYSNATNAEYDYGSSLLTPTSTGFNLTTTDADHNTNTGTYVAWSWKANGTGVTNTAGSITSTVSANTTSGFSIATFTTPSSGTSSFGHGLGVTPAFVIVKSRASGNWICEHTSTGSQYLLLNSTSAATTDSTVFNSAPTSSVVNLGTGFAGSVNYVAYCFAQVAGYSAFGSYTGNGSSDGTFVFTGFRPRYYILKNITNAQSWSVQDTARSPYNVGSAVLLPNSSSAELTGTDFVDILSNGFKIRHSSSGNNNNNGDTYIYMAFAESPFKFSNAR